MEYTIAPGPDVDNIRMILVGCGGTGGFVAEALCRLFTGRPAEMILVDHDVVEPHNLLRQNFTPKDVGRYKSQALAERLSTDFQRTIGYHTGEFGQTSGRLLSGYNRMTLLIGSVDNAEARASMMDALEQTGGRTWWIDAGNGEKWGQVLLGNIASRKGKFEDSIRNGRCAAIPVPALQRPDLLTHVPETPPDVDCAAALDLTDQDPSINRMMADMVVMTVRRLVSGSCNYMGLYLDMDLPSMWSKPVTPKEIARIANIEEKQLITQCWHNPRKLEQ